MSNLAEIVGKWLRDESDRLTAMGLRAQLKVTRESSQSIGIDLDTEHVCSTVCIWSNGNAELIVVSAVTGQTVIVQEVVVESSKEVCDQLGSWATKVSRYRESKHNYTLQQTGDE